jgi:hypothetical protein
MKKVVENATPKKLTKIMKNDPILAPFSLPWPVAGADLLDRMVTFQEK